MSHQLSCTGTDACEPEAELLPSDDTYTPQEFPGYEQSDEAILCSINDPKIRIQRTQISGLCYLHAVAVVQYYSVWHWALQNQPLRQPRHGMLDIAWHITQNFRPAELEQYVFHDSGGDSPSHLRRILQPNSKLVVPGLGKSVADVMGYLRRYGPALVSQFSVYKDFDDMTVHHHRCTPQGGFVGTHAMVLVGMRRDRADGKYYFLLQNWWEDKQFVEVSEEYFDACQARCFFVETPQEDVPKVLHTHPSTVRYVETQPEMERPEGAAPEKAMSA